jgi:hypothetical protein
MGSNPTGVVIACLWLLSQPEWRNSSGGNIDVPVGGEGGADRSEGVDSETPGPAYRGSHRNVSNACPGEKGKRATSGRERGEGARRALRFLLLRGACIRSGVARRLACWAHNPKVRGYVEIAGNEHPPAWAAHVRIRSIWR